jgi:hypothetical protein
MQGETRLVSAYGKAVRTMAASLTLSEQYRLFFQPLRCDIGKALSGVPLLTVTDRSFTQEDVLRAGRRGTTVG